MNLHATATIWAGAACTLLVLAGCAAETDQAGKPAMVDSAASAKDELRSVMLTIGGGRCCPQCGDCCECNVVRRGVMASGELELADMAHPGMPSEEHFKLSAQDYASIVELVSSPAFATAIDDNQDCPTVFESAISVELHWKQRGLQVDNAAAGCIRGRGESAHVYTQLYWKLIDLQLEFLHCPPYPPGQLSPLRPLCNGCFAWSEDPC